MFGMILPGTKVIGSDWNDIGEVKYLIIDPLSSQIIRFVVQTRTFEDAYKLLDIETVCQVLDNGALVRLNLNRDEVAVQNDFVRKNYLGAAELTGDSNIILYNSKSRAFVLPPTEEYLYLLTDELRVVELNNVQKVQAL